MQVLADKSLITISSDMTLQMHDLIQAMAREIIHEESIMSRKHRRLFISSNVYDISGQNKVALTEAVEVIVLSLEKCSQKVHIDANDFAHMKKLRILKIYQEKERRLRKHELKGHNVIFTGNLYYLSNELSLFYWHGCPFKYLPSYFYPQNIVAIDLSYSNIKQLWTTPKSFRRLKLMKLRFCRNLTTTPDFSEITNLEELCLEGCVNLVSVHPSIGMLKRLVVLNLTGCLKVDQLPETLGQIKSLTELHVYRTAITELPSFVYSLINLESLSFGGQWRDQPTWWTLITAPFGLLSKQQHPPRSIISLAGLPMIKGPNFSYCNLEQVPRWWTSITAPFGFTWNQQHPQRPVSLAGLHMLRSLNLSYCHLLEVPESIGGLLCLVRLELNGNLFSSLPGSLSQLSRLAFLCVYDCRKLEVLPELPPTLWHINASDCPSLRNLLGSCKDWVNEFRYCPNLFKNTSIDSEVSISKSQCLDSSITSQGLSNQIYAFLGYVGIQTNNRCEFFRLPRSAFYFLNVAYYGNSIPEWFTNRSRKNHVRVGLPSDWSYDKLRGYGFCVVFKCKNPFTRFEGISIKNFDGAYLKPKNYCPPALEEFWKDVVIRFVYVKYMEGWEEAKNFVTFCFEEYNEDVEVKECGVRLICDEDIQQETDTSMLQYLPAPIQQCGGVLCLNAKSSPAYWSW